MRKKSAALGNMKEIAKEKKTSECTCKRNKLWYFVFTICIFFGVLAAIFLIAPKTTQKRIETNLLEQNQSDIDDMKLKVDSAMSKLIEIENSLKQQSFAIDTLTKAKDNLFKRVSAIEASTSNKESEN